MLNNIYISAPITVDWSTVVRYQQELISGSNRKFKVSVWDRKSKYDQREFDSSDAVVFILPNNNFNASQDDLPIGLKNELSRAYAQDKEIFVAYRTNGGSYNIYDAETNGKWIKGVSGTASDIFGSTKVLQNSLDIFVGKVMNNSSCRPWSTNPCAEIELPKGPTGSNGRKGVSGVEGIEFDERLLLIP